MPQPLGTVLSSTCAGGAVVVRFEVTNKDLKARTVQTGVNGPAATRVDFDPASLTLGPMERGVVTAKLSLPADAAEGAEYEAILWIRGCRDYYLRWTVTVGVTDGGCCSAIEVVDGPDYVHHWYDHFYIERPCHNDKA
jgi:hypothetical protein